MSAPAPWAVITGASSGIGAEFAKQYAARGFNLMLVARRRERLVSQAQEITRCYPVQVDIQVLDLSQVQSAQALTQYLLDSGRRIEVLINNAGYGMPGSYLSHPWQAHADFQQVMVNSVAELCYRIVPQMRAQRSGTIINVASLAGLMPGSAGHTLYGPSKAWLIKFSESLSFELAPDLIRVMALCPGFTYSEFHDVNGMRAQVSRLPSWLWMTAEEVVASGLTAVEQGKRVYIPGRINRVLALLARLLPQRLLRALIGRRERDFRRVD